MCGDSGSDSGGNDSTTTGVGKSPNAGSVPNETQVGSKGGVTSSSGVGSRADLESQGFDMTTWDDVADDPGWATSSTPDVVGYDQRESNRKSNPFDRDGDGSMFTSTSLSGVVTGPFGNVQSYPGPDSLNNGVTKEQFVQDALTAKGFSDSYKGVRGGNGSAVLDGNNNPVRSGSYAATESQASAEYDAMVSYQNARSYAEQQWAANQANQIRDGMYISQDLIDMATGKVAGATQTQISAAQNEFGDLYGRGYAVQGGTFDDPLGQYMDSSIAAMNQGNFLGSDLSANSFTNNFMSGYNARGGNKDTNGMQMEVDQAGNIGFSTRGQRFGDAAGRVVKSLVGSSLGPVGSLALGGVNNNTMNLYGANVPGYGPVASTMSFGPGEVLGNFLGGQLGNAVAPAVAQGIYGQTGNVDLAIGMGVATGVTSSVAGQYAGGYGANMLGMQDFVISSDIGSPYAGQMNSSLEGQGLDRNGFSLNLGDEGGGSGTPAQAASEGGILQVRDQSLSAPQDGGGQPTGQPIQYANSSQGQDLAAGDLPSDGSESYFDAEYWRRMQLSNMNPNSQQVTALNGTSYQSEPNPLFSMGTPQGVQYMSQGRQRDYGNATYSVAEPLQQYRGARRRGIGDRLVGIVV
jgi:hypothetical protein